ncbi:hypothetical protein [Actinomadura madurae]|uniref:hypothetical protein n=1 Tax=Actinomadura madurae TaxID=1993 RepID=UPI0020D249DB|nr:hypothetical protein [Actinomadura madurae]MCP9980258.1 hypothetical protein [Actinomadura madurae]
MLPPQSSPVAWLARRPLLAAALGAVVVIMAADKVTEHLEKIAEHLREGKDDELAEKVAEIRDKLERPPAGAAGRPTPPPCASSTRRPPRSDSLQINGHVGVFASLWSMGAAGGEREE